MKIAVHIERLVLDGLPVRHGQASQVRTALEGELTRLLRMGDVSPDLLAGGAIPSMRAGTVSVNAQTSGRSVGRDIGRAIYRGMVP